MRLKQLALNHYRESESGQREIATRAAELGRFAHALATAGFPEKMSDVVDNPDVIDGMVFLFVSGDLFVRTTNDSRGARAPDYKGATWAKFRNLADLGGILSRGEVYRVENDE